MNNFRVRRYVPIWPLLLIGVSVGCSKSPLDLIPAGGMVTLANGSLPECQVRVVRFEPVADATGRISRRAATGDVQPDGTFQLMTLRPGDGAMAGAYKPVLLFLKSSHSPESVLPVRYGSVETTPLATINIKPDEKNYFALVVENR